MSDKRSFEADSSEVDSPTGWPDAEPVHPDDPTKPIPTQSGSTQPMLTGSDPETAVTPAPRGRARRWGARAFWASIVAGVIVILLLATTILGKWPNLHNPFGTRTTDRSQPVLLLSIKDLARFEAASGNFQVVVDIQQDQKFIPDIIFSQRSLFVAAGIVNAYVDFSDIGSKDIVALQDQKTVTINLPAPQLDSPQLDLSRSYVYSQSSGLINKISGLFTSDPNKQKELYLFAQQKIAAAAVDSELTDRAATNTRAMLTGLLKSLGYTTITVNFAST